MNPTTDTPPQPAAVTRITIGRLHNLGNYEHVRYEVTVDVPDPSQAGTTLAELESILDDLEPKCPVDNYQLRNAAEALEKPAGELTDYETRNLETYKSTVERHREWQVKRAAAHERLSHLPVKVAYKDAKDEWDNHP